MLPEPVRRYLRFTVREGTRAIRTARLQHDGFFRTKPDQRWLPIDGEQYFTTAAPDFVWHATVRPLPLTWIEAHDCLVGGRGNMLVKLESIFPMADAAGPEIGKGASLHWLAESAWFPYALVGDAISWEPIDTRSARATIRNGGLPVSAVFEIDAEGRLARLHAERYCDIGGTGFVVVVGYFLVDGEFYTTWTLVFVMLAMAAPPGAAGVLLMQSRKTDSPLKS